MSRHTTAIDTHKKQITYELKIKENALRELSNRAPSTYKNDIKSDRTILRGHFCCDHFLNAIQLHSSDTMEVIDHTVEGLLEPALTVCIILEGQVSGQLGDTKFTLDASNGPAAYIWGYGKPTYWYRHIRSGMKVRKITVSVEAEWLRKQLVTGDADSTKISDLLDSPFHVIQWQPSSRSVALTNQIIMQQHHNPLIQHIRRESRALEILGEALEKLPHKGSKPGHSTNDTDKRYLNRAEQIRDYIERRDMGTLSLSVLSNELGFSIGSMQTSFKRAFNMTVMDYIRERRLIIARNAMEQDGLTISKAAFLAGYNSPANFSTAFKRHFGISPSELHLIEI